jgi:hypothetical protein
VARLIGEAMGCRCIEGTLFREVPLTDDGYLLDNPDWKCHWCDLAKPENNPERLAPWAPEEMRAQYAAIKSDSYKETRGPSVDADHRCHHGDDQDRRHDRGR